MDDLKNECRVNTRNGETHAARLKHQKSVENVQLAFTRKNRKS
jgi:hypothetical protein